MDTKQSTERAAALLRWASRTRPSWMPRTVTAGATAVRLLAGFIFLTSGTLKEVRPRTHANWVAMIHQVGLPLQPVAVQMGAVLEIVVGVLLLAGLLARLAALGGLGLMVGAAWIHLTVESSALPQGLPPDWFPILTALACAVVLWQGAGAWSLDRRRASGVEAEFLAGAVPPRAPVRT